MTATATADALREKDAQALAALDLDVNSSCFWDCLTEGLREAIEGWDMLFRDDYVGEEGFDQAKADRDVQAWLTDSTSSVCVGLAAQAEDIWADAPIDGEAGAGVRLFALRQVLADLDDLPETELFATVLAYHGWDDLSRECSVALHAALSRARGAIDEYRLTGDAVALGGSTSLPMALVRQLGVTP